VKADRPVDAIPAVPGECLPKGTKPGKKGKVIVSSSIGAKNKRQIPKILVQSLILIDC